MYTLVYACWCLLLDNFNFVVLADYQLLIVTLQMIQDRFIWAKHVGKLYVFEMEEGNYT